MRSKISKIAMMLLLVFCMTVSIFKIDVFAADSDSTSKIDACERVVQEYSAEKAAKYLDGENTYPKLEGYLFSGWYTDEACDKESALAGKTPSGTVYALFVPEHVLSVQAQVNAYLTDDDATNDSSSSIRFVTTVDSLLYKKVGFEVSYVGADGTVKSAKSVSNKVYRQLYVAGSNSEVWEVTPEGTFCGLSTYFKACTIKNVPEANYETKFTVKPFWETLDGDIVYGVEATKSIVEGCTRKEAWISTDTTVAKDELNYGGYANPYATLEYALAQIEDGGTVHVKDDFTFAADYAWTAHGKNVIITGDDKDDTVETLDFSALGDLCINDGVTFRSIGLKFPTQDLKRVFAEGHKLVIEDTVSITNTVQLIGGAKSKAVESTNLEVYAGTYSAIYGGSATKDVLGNTNVIVGKGVNPDVDYTSHAYSNLLFGAGWSGTVYGDTNITVENGAIFNYIYGGGDDAGSTVKGSTNIKFAGNTMGIYGGSRNGVSGDSHVVMTGGNAYQIFGGSEGNFLTGDTDVQILGGNVLRRIYGGCYNEYGWSGWESSYQVTGHTNVTIGPDANASLDEDTDQGLLAVSRYGSSFANEWGALIFNDNMYSSLSSEIGSNAFSTQAYHYLVKANAGGDVYGAGECIYIKPDSGNVATVTIDGVVKHYTEGNSYYVLPTLSASTSQEEIIVTFNTTEATDFIASAEAKIATNSGYAYFETLEQAIVAAEKMDNATIETEEALASITVKDSKNGTATSSCKNCVPGTTVTLTVTPDEGYNLTNLSVTKDGTPVEIATTFAGGTYSIVTEEGNYTVEAEFKPIIWKDTNAEWDVDGQYEGIVSVPSGDGDTSWLDSYSTEYEDFDLKLTLRDQNNSAGNYRAAVRLLFENGEYVTFTITNARNADDETTVYELQNMGGSILNWKNTGYVLNDAQVAKLTGDEGMEFRIVRVKDVVDVYLDGVHAWEADISTAVKDEVSYPSGVANLTTQIILRVYGNSGVSTDIPFSIGDAPEMGTITIKDTENGTVTASTTKYCIGDEVTITVAGDNCDDTDYTNDYYYDSLKVDEKEVAVDSDGKYTFKATEIAYDVTGSFAQTIFQSDHPEQWDIMNQHKGIVYQKQEVTGNTDWLYVVGTYVDSDTSIIVKAGADDFDENGNFIDTGYENAEGKIVQVGDRTAIRYYGNTSKKNYGYSILLQDGKYYIGDSGSANGYNGSIHTFTDEETQKVKEEGIELRLIKIGTEVHIYLDDKFIATDTLDLFGENEGTRVIIQRFDDGGVRVPIGYKFSETIPETVALDIVENEGGTITTDCQNYFIGENVTITVTPNETYECTGLKVAGEEVSLTDGTYTFKATEASYKIEASYKQISTIKVAETTNGTVAKDSDKYYIGDEVTLTVTPDEKYDCTSLKVDGEEVTLTNGMSGTYTFTASNVSHEVEATFTRKIFGNSADWDVTGQYDGMLRIPSSDGDSGWVETIDKIYGDIDFKVTLRDQTQADANYRAAVRLYYTNNQYISFTLTNDRVDDDDPSVYELQTMGGTIYNWSDSEYDLSSDMVAKLTGEEGLEFRLVRKGNTANIYLDGTFAYGYDLSKTGEENSVENLKSSIVLRFYGNSGKEVEVPFTIGDAPETVTVDIAETSNGTITSDKTEYIVGENVVLTVAGANCDDTDYTNDYYYDSLNVNGEEVTVDSNGNYTFKATETNTVTGSFAASIFKSNQAASWDIMNQHKGIIYQKDTVTGNAPNLDLVGSRVNSDTSIILKAGKDDFNEDGTLKDTNGDRTAICYWSSTATVGFGINLHTDGKYYIGNSAGYNGYDQGIHTFTEEETKLIKEEGIELRVVRNGSDAHIYLDGKFITTYTLPYAADEATTTFIKRWDDAGVRAPIEYKFSEADPTPVTLSFATTENGSFSQVKDYIVGEQVTIKAQGTDGYACNYITVDGEAVSLAADGTYTFKATKASYEIAGTFAESQFATNANWNVQGQFYGNLYVPANTNGNTGWLNTSGNYTEISAVARDLTSTANDYALVMKLEFPGGKWVGIRLADVDENGVWRLQSMGDTPFNWGTHYTLNDEEIAKVTGEGLEFKMIRKGTTLELYLGGNLVKELDLTGRSSGITAETEVTGAGYRLYGNNDGTLETVMPYALVEAIPVEVSISDTINGTVVADNTVYYVGDTVTLTGTSRNGYA